jgi:hypothetical protein
VQEESLGLAGPREAPDGTGTGRVNWRLRITAKITI